MEHFYSKSLKELPIYLDKIKTKVKKENLSHGSLYSTVTYMHTQFQTTNNITCLDIDD